MTRRKIIQLTVPLFLASILHLNGAMKRSVVVSWQNVAGASGYDVFWGKASGNYSLQFDAGASLSCKITRLNAGATYYFAAKAYNATTESGYSNEVAFKV